MKPLFVISCPYDTYSGYGARSRDLVKAIIETDKYEVKLIPQRWGSTPFGFCKNNPEWEFLYKHNLIPTQHNPQPDNWMQITVPNEFQKIGKFNIGCTAGIESNICSAEWIEGLNRMDLILSSSEHTKKVFEESKFEKKDKNTNQTQEIIELKTPVEVLFEGANTDVYKVIESHQIKNIDLNSIKEKFAYLFVGHWMEGDLGEDRKNVGLLVKAFLETFKNKKQKPALILKTSGANSSYVDRKIILSKIKSIRDTVDSKNLPNIYLLHGDFTDEEMNSLYNHSKVKAMVSLTKGEGFGRPLLEFTLSKKPLITTAWSGHMDFLNPEFNTLIGGNLNNVHPSAANNMITKESQWFSPNHAEIGQALKNGFENYKKLVDGGKRQSYHSKTNFSWENMKEVLSLLLKNYIPVISKENKLKLPRMNKIELPKMNKTNG